jgi:hypothetical protein
MKITTEIELEPLSVPKFVRAKQKPQPRQNGLNFNAGAIPISELSEEVINNLVEEFRQGLLKQRK